MIKPKKPATETAKPTGFDYSVKPEHKEIKAANEAAAPTLDYKKMNAPAPSKPKWKENWDAKPQHEKKAIQDKLMAQRGQKEPSLGTTAIDTIKARAIKSEESPEGLTKGYNNLVSTEVAVDGALERWKKIHTQPNKVDDKSKDIHDERAPEEHQSLFKEAEATQLKSEPSKVDKSDWSKEPITIDDGYKKRNIKKTADKGAEMVRVLRATKAKKKAAVEKSNKGKPTEELTKAGAFHKKPVLEAGNLLAKWKKKATPPVGAPVMKSSVDVSKERAKLHEPDYSTSVNKKVATLKAANKNKTEPSLESKVSELKNKYKSMHKSHKEEAHGMKKLSKGEMDSAAPQLDPGGVASIKGAFGKSEGGSSLAKWKAKHSAKAIDKSTGHEKGVHKPLDAKRYGPGKSAAGMASPGVSKVMHEDKLAELKTMPKPDLGKAIGISETVSATSSAPKIPAAPKMPKTQTIKNVAPAPVQKSWEVEGEVPMKKSNDLAKSEWKSPAHSCHGKLAVMLNKMRGTSPKAMDKSDGSDSQPDMASEQLSEIATHLQEIMASGAVAGMDDEMKSKLTLANDYLSTLAHYLQSEPELHGAVTDLVHNGSSGTEDQAAQAPQPEV